MKRSQTADRVATLRSATTPNPADLADATTQLVQLTRRAVMMESQVDVLQGKQKALGRYHEALERYGALLRDVAAGGGWSAPPVRRARRHPVRAQPAARAATTAMCRRPSRDSC